MRFAILVALAAIQLTATELKPITSEQRAHLENVELRRELAMKELENAGLLKREIIRTICDSAQVPIEKCQINTRAWTVGEMPQQQSKATEVKPEEKEKPNEENSNGQ